MDMGVWGGGDSGAHFSETGVDGIRGLVEQLAFDACTITTYKRHQGDEAAMAGMDLARSFPKRDRGRRNGKILLSLVS